MIGAEVLESLSVYLDKLRRSNSKELASIVGNLNAVYETPGYQRWLEVEQFYGPADRRGRFELPAELFSQKPEEKWLLDRLGLVLHDRLQVKIDRQGGRLLLTDGPWVSAKVRVFPFSDESELLCAYARENRLDSWAQVLIDPACGCGHHGLGLANVPVRVSLDINPRALVFSRINTILNGADEMLLGINDIFHGIPRALTDYLSGNVLFQVNMPFAIFPASASDRGSLAQDGGDRGIALTQAALEGIAKFATANTGAEAIRALVLAYSLGKSATGPWEVVEIAERLFPNCDISFRIAEHEPMWRVNGRKEQSNPMPIESLKLKAGCRHTFSEQDEPTKREGYEALEKLFRQNGYTHLAYGVLDVNVR